MPFLEHVSYPSNPDKRGFRRWVSIDASTKKKSKGICTVVYEGLSISLGGYADSSHRCLVLATFLDKSRNNTETRLFAEETLEMNSLIQDFTDKFNNTLSYVVATKNKQYYVEEMIKSITIHFQNLQMANLESVSRGFSFKKDRREGEYFVFGDKLSKCKVLLDSKKESTRYVSRIRSSKSFCEGEDESDSSDTRANGIGRPGAHPPFGKTRSYSFQQTSDEYLDDLADTEKLDPDWVLRAYTHHFFCHMQGRMVVDHLSGCHDTEEGYTLITPTIHSLSQFKNMPGNCGLEGMERVIKSHRCNVYCRHLPKMSTILDRVIFQQRFAKHSMDQHFSFVDSFEEQQKITPGSSMSSFTEVHLVL